jgi:hypothetical protein
LARSSVLIDRGLYPEDLSWPTVFILSKSFIQ